MRYFLEKSLIFLMIMAIVQAAVLTISGEFSLANADQESSDSKVNSEKARIAPDITLKNVNGDKVSLTDFRGSILILAIVFGDESARDLEEYRKRMHSDLKEKGITFLKVVDVNKPPFITEEFIQARMKKKLADVPDAPKDTLLDCGGTLDLGAKYEIKDKDTPALFIIGKEGEILFSFQGKFSEDNLSKLGNELATILEEAK